MSNRCLYGIDNRGVMTFGTNDQHIIYRISERVEKTITIQQKINPDIPFGINVMVNESLFGRVHMKNKKYGKK